MTSSNVSAAKPKKGGSIWRAPKGTVLPTSVTEALNEAFKNMGYCSEDGITNANNPESEKEKAWGGNVVLNVMIEKNDTFKMKLIESLNVDVLKAIYGEENVTGSLTEGITVQANTKDMEEFAWVIDMMMKDGAAKRIVVPQGKITEMEEINYVDNKSIGYGITVSATPDTQGNTHYEYILKTQASQASQASQ